MQQPFYLQDGNLIVIYTMIAIFSYLQCGHPNQLTYCETQVYFVMNYLFFILHLHLNSIF